MAARSFNKFSDITDCEMCCCLCLGPTVLPCGHLFCRQCVRHLMQGGSACPTCGQSIPGPAGKTIRKAMKNLARDLVIEDLVTVRLARQGCVPCHMCPNTNASQVCLDCGIYFCKCCVTDHTSFTGTTSDHILVRLPKCPSGKETDIKESLRKEARLMYDVIGQLTKAKSDVASSINRLHEMERGLTRKIELLAMYATRLTSPDNGLIMTATSFLPRAQRVRDDCQQPQAADKGRPLCYLCNVRQDGGQTKVAAKAQDGDVKMVTKIQDGEEIVEIDLTSHQSADQNQNLPLDPLSLFQDPASTSQDLLTCTARRTCIIQPITADDPGHPWSISLLMTSQKQLVMADYSNSMLKVVSLSRPFAVWGIKLDLPPWGVARLQDGTLAVTAANESIFLCDVTADHVFVVSRFHTTRQYWGVGAGLDDTLVVSCCDVPCTIDIVTRCGDLLRTLLTSTCVTDFCCPHFLCVKSGDVLVSDVTCHAVFRVKLATGRLVETLRHPELRRPHQIAVDGAENIYVASEDGSCVLVRSASGQWRRLLYGPHHGDCDCERPVGICLTGSVLLVSWHKRYADCVVIGYEFM